jgi:hypothetical protein
MPETAEQKKARLAREQAAASATTRHRRVRRGSVSDHKGSHRHGAAESRGRKAIAKRSRVLNREKRGGGRKARKGDGR